MHDTSTLSAEERAVIDSHKRYCGTGVMSYRDHAHPWDNHRGSQPPEPGARISLVPGIDDTPAQRAGIKEGDRIIAFYDKGKWRDMIGYQGHLFTGPINSLGTFLVLTPGEEGLREVTIQRDWIVFIDETMNEQHKQLLRDHLDLIPLRDPTEEECYHLSRSAPITPEADLADLGQLPAALLLSDARRAARVRA